MDVNFAIDVTIYIVGLIVGTGVVTRATNKFIFKSFGHKKKAVYSFKGVSVFFVLGYGSIAIIGIVIWLIYDLKRMPEDKKQKRINWSE